MILENMASVRKKRVSKKKKKSWRKHIDIKDVDNFLEDKRLEERLGVKYSEQKNEDLFKIDTEGQDENSKSFITDSERILTIYNESKRFCLSGPVKCFEALTNKSAVPPPITAKKVKFKEKSSLGKKIHKKKLNILKQKENNAITQRTIDSKKRENKNKSFDFTYDVWSTNNNDRDLNGYAEWLTNDTIRHTLHNTGKLRKQIPNTIHSKTSLLPAVELPHPGISYNPSLKDHTSVLQEVAKKELDLINEEKHLDRVTTKMFSKLPSKVIEKEWLNEMTAGLVMEKSDSEDDVEEYRAINPPVRNRKKTLQKRRRLKEAIMLKEKLRQQKIEKRKISDIYKLRKFNEAINEKEELTKKKIIKKQEVKKSKPFVTKKLSQVKYQEPEIDFHLAEELSGNLRSMKPEGNLVYDRFKSLQKRNILQPTKKRHVKKSKVKHYERAHTKMGWEPKGYVPFENKHNVKKI